MEYLTIGDTTYRQRRLPAMTSWALALDLTRTFSEVGVRLITGEFSGQASSIDQVAHLLRIGLYGLSADVTEDLTLRVLASVQVDGMGPQENLGNLKAFNAHFDQVGLFRVAEVWQWAVKTEFASFFADARSRISMSQMGTGEGAADSTGQT